MKVYLDPSSWADGEGFDVSVAANGQDGNHVRDFIFHVTQDTSTGELQVGASNNTNFDPREDLETINFATIDAADWYTFSWDFFENDSGDLAVALSVFDSNGDWVFTEVLSTPGDDIATTVGGNRYMWFTNIDVAGGIAVDDIEFRHFDDNPVQVLDGGTVLTTHLTIADAIAASVEGNTIQFPSGDYSGEGTLTVDVNDLTFDGAEGATGVDLVMAEPVAPEDHGATPSVPAPSSDVVELSLAGEADINVTGNSLDNTITGNNGDNVLSGGDGMDTLDGGAGSDTLNGDDGADSLDGGEGDDALNGGEGSDTASYDGPSSDYSISVTIDGTTGLATSFSAVTDNNSMNGDEGADTLDSIETLSFNGGMEIVSLDGAVQVFDENGDFVNSYSSIQAAVDATSDGYTVIVSEGTYMENVVVSTDITLMGVDAAVIDGRASASTSGTTLIGSVHFTLGSDGATLDNFNVQEGSMILGELATAYIQAANISILNTNFSRSGPVDFDASRGVVTATGSGDGLTISGSSFMGFHTGTYLNPGILLASIMNNNFDGNMVGMSMDISDEATALTVDNNMFNNMFENIGVGAFEDPLDMSGQILGGNSFSGSAPEVSVYPLTGGYLEYTGTVFADLFNGDQTDVNGMQLVWSGAGDDILNMGGGDDFAWGGDGNDQITATSGNNSLRGEAGDDFLQGGSDNDLLDGGTGADLMLGGLGNDTYIVDNGGDLAIELPGQGTDTVQASISYQLTQNMENLELTGSNNINGFGNNLDNSLSGNSGNNILSGLDGNDTIFGHDGDDNLAGGEGDDALNGGNGVDKIFGQNGTDTINGDGGDDDVFGGNGDDIINGGADNDILRGQADNDTIDGGAGDDTVLGGSGNDNVSGGDGNDIVTGASGDDDLFGNDGNDNVIGGSGSDNITGGAGNDTLLGQADADVFHFADGFGNDVIVDFEDGVDLIDFSSHTMVDEFSDLTVSQIGTNVLIEYGADSILLRNTNVADITEDDFDFGMIF